MAVPTTLRDRITMTSNLEERLYGRVTTLRPSAISDLPPPFRLPVKM